MPSIVFVHGTGVRGAAYRLSLQKVREQAAKHRPDFEIHECLWGDLLGANLRAGGASIPLYDATLGILDREPDDAERELALWQLLYQDPLFELQAVAEAADSEGDPQRSPFEESPAEPLWEQLRSVEQNPSVDALLVRAGLSQEFAASRNWVLNTPTAAHLLENPGNAIPELGKILARACVAGAVARKDRPEGAEAELQYVLDADLRNELIDAISVATGQTLGFGSWTAGLLFGLAQRLGALNFLERKRGAISNAAYPGAGDILLYQARGQEIRDFIRARVEAAPGPVILLGHSLGGIACVDLLVQQPLPQVKMLATVGSQSALLYEINAMVSLPFGEQLPESFPRWLNIYDLKDILSYIGGAVFPGRVQDVLVDNKQPFPQSHSAYWDNVATWKAIFNFWKGL